jgi:aspartate aminotransferase
MAAGSAFHASSLVSAIGVSEILQLGNKAEALRAAGRDIIVLGAGEPDFDTPEFIKAAAIRAIQEGQTKYTALDGSSELKEAIQAKFLRDNGLRFGKDQISVGCGAKQVIYNALVATLDPGDEVIVPAPYWVTYLDIVRILGGMPVVVPCAESRGFRLSPADLERAITPRTRWLILNSPGNPSGATYRGSDYELLMDVLRRHPRVWVLADDIYEHIRYVAEPFTTAAQAAPDLADRILTVNGVSKAYAMTGWRIGYGAGPAPLIRSMAVAQSQSTSCPSSISQAAAVAALLGDQSLLEVRRESFRARRDLVVRALGAVPGLTCREPEGAFYAYVGCSGLVGRRTPNGTILDGDRAIAEYLLGSVGVAVVAGSSFGLAPYFRLSYASSPSQLAAACERIGQAVRELH